MYPWEEYIKAVRTGQRNAGRLEKMAVEHCMKLQRSYEFDTTEAERVINLISHFKHTKGKWRGTPFNLLPHQSFFIAYLFGLKKPNGFRLISEAMINMAKKGGKSELDGAIAVVMTFFDGEQTAECYTAANKTEQALFSWKSAKGICTQLADEFPEFKQDFKYYDNRLDHVLIQPSSENFFKTLPYESKSLDGVNPHFAIIDEFHEYPDMSLPDNLQSGMVLRDQSLLLYSTTRGFHPWGPLAQKEEYYENVLKGLVDDHTVLPLIYALDDDNNWQNKNYWIQFAPGIDDNLPSYEAIEGEMKKKIEEGGESLARCKVKNFNMWQRSKEAFVDMDDWDKGSDPIKEEELHGRRCFAAFDVGRSNDLSAYTLLFPPEKEGEKFKALCRFFMPIELVQQRSIDHRVSYQQWIDKGYIIASPGNFTDTIVIFDKMLKDLENFNVENIAADKAFAIELINQLLALGHPAIEYPQRYSTMNAPILRLQKMIGKQEIQHGGNPVLGWNIANVALKRNTGGQVMMDKSDRITGHGKEASRTKRKIDGAVALTMCIGMYLDWLKENSEPVDEIKFL